jgi:hypothetical protein
MSLYPQLAGDRSVDTAADQAFFIGDAPVGTDSANALADITQYQVCVLLVNGVTPYVVATHTTAAPDKLVIAQVTAGTGKQAPYYTRGKFNHNMIVWPASLDTYAKRKEAFLGSAIEIGHAKPASS